MTAAAQQLTPVQMQQAWRERTQRSELPMDSQTWKGFGKKQTIEVEKLGVLARALVKIKITGETTGEAAGETKPAPGAPYSVIDEIKLRANGVAGVISCKGELLESRERIIDRTPVHAVGPGTHTEAGTSIAVKTKFEWEFILEVPIAEDLVDLVGVALAQSQQEQLVLEFNWKTEGEMFTTLTHPLAKSEGDIEWAITWFSIGEMTVGNKTELLLPNVDTIHSIIQRDPESFNAAGNVAAPLTRTSGELLRYWATAWDGDAGQYDPLEWDSFAFKYGGNQEPLRWEPASMLIEDNARAYKERLNVNGIKYAVIDTTLDDALRDAIRPYNLTEVRTVLGIKGAIGENSSVETAQEQLYPAEA